MGLLKFYTDANIDKQVAIQLRQHDIIVIRCQDIGMDNVTDEEHLEYATEHGLSIITKDIDFRSLHFQWLVDEKTHFGIFYCADCQVGVIGRIVNECLTYFQITESVEDIINQFIDI